MRSTLSLLRDHSTIDRRSATMLTSKQEHILSHNSQSHWSHSDRDMTSFYKTTLSQRRECASTLDNNTQTESRGKMKTADTRCTTVTGRRIIDGTTQDNKRGLKTVFVSTRLHFRFPFYFAFKYEILHIGVYSLIMPIVGCKLKNITIGVTQSVPCSRCRTQCKSAPILTLQCGRFETR